MASGTPELASPFYEHNKNILDQLKPGDLVKFKRSVFYHWAVHIGKGKVIHVTGRYGEEMSAGKEGSKITAPCSVPQDKAEVVEDDFWDVAGESKAEIGNMKVEGWIPLDTKAILERARRKLGKVKDHLYGDNCEHFAKWCRYDRSGLAEFEVSKQNTLSILVSLITGVQMTVLIQANNPK